jgi:hypothetical protein
MLPAMEQIKNTGACLHPRRSSATPQDGFQRASFVSREFNGLCFSWHTGKVDQEAAFIK